MYPTGGITLGNTICTHNVAYKTIKWHSTHTDIECLDCGTRGQLDSYGNFTWGSTSASSSVLQGALATYKAPKPQTAQPYSKFVKNDGRLCLYCGRLTKELVLLNSITRYCPPCETTAQEPQNKRVDDDWNDMLSSIDDILKDVK